MQKMTITIDKEFIENYRKYKIDLTFGKCDIDMDFEIFRHILEQSLDNLNNISNKIDNGTATISNDDETDFDYDEIDDDYISF